MKRLLRKNIEIVVFCVIGLGLLAPLKAKVRPITSGSSFERIIGKTPYAVVMFYDYDRGMRKINNQLFKRNAQLEGIFKSVSDRGVYQEAGIQFLLVNVSRDHLQVIAQNYGFNDIPVCALFKNGMPVVNRIGQKVSLRGFVSQEKLYNLIDASWGKEIDAIIKDKQEIRKEEARERALYRPSINFGFGYPYYGYDYGPYYSGYWGRWGRPYFGIGF